MHGNGQRFNGRRIPIGDAVGQRPNKFSRRSGTLRETAGDVYSHALLLGADGTPARDAQSTDTTRIIRLYDDSLPDLEFGYVGPNSNHPAHNFVSQNERIRNKPMAHIKRDVGAADAGECRLNHYFIRFEPGFSSLINENLFGTNQ
jgi:hypothetical protein